MKNFEIKIGAEIHCKLKTKSKLFSPSPSTKREPNKNINPIDLGLVGVLPSRVNKTAVKKASKLINILGLKPADFISFDRKHYYFPDLPKGFQITQFFNPLGKQKVEEKNTNHQANNTSPLIKQIQLEEDSGKRVKDKNYKWMIDFNRCGESLVEIVSYPFLIKEERDIETFINFLKILHLIVKLESISLGRMEEGEFRFDLNISISPSNSREEDFLIMTEIKNLNSFKYAKKAIQIELKSHKKKVETKKNQEYFTATFVPKIQQIIKTRIKKKRSNYFFIREENLPPFVLPKIFRKKSSSQIIKRALEYSSLFSLKISVVLALIEKEKQILLTEMFEVISKKKLNKDSKKEFFIFLSEKKYLKNYLKLFKTKKEKERTKTVKTRKKKVKKIPSSEELNDFIDKFPKIIEKYQTNIKKRPRLINLIS